MRTRHTLQARRRGRAALTGLLCLALAAGASTAATAATDARPDLPVWVDDFDGTALADAWEVVQPVDDALRVEDGALHLTSQPGDTYGPGSTAKNVVLLDVPAGDFTLVTRVDGEPGQVFQGAGLIAWQDVDSYVRTGLTYVGDLTPSGRAVEVDHETGGAFTAVGFADRPGSTGETLRMQRTGDVVTASYLDAGTWVEVASTTVAFDVRQVGVYALAALDGTPHEVSFDYVALDAPEGADQVPDGAFTLTGTGAREHLVLDGALALAEERPATVVALEAQALPAQDGALPLTLTVDGLPVVVRRDALVVGRAHDDPTAFRLTDVGGGRVVLHLAGGDRWVGVGDDGVLRLGAEADAVRLTVSAVTWTEHELTVDTAADRTDVSDDLYGVFYEDINWAADGGLYAELVRNRSFEFSTADNASYTGTTAWETVDRAGATATMTAVADDQRLNDANRTSLVLAADGAGAGVRNSGFDGVDVTAGAAYDASLWVRTTTAQTLTVQVEDASGADVLAAGTVEVDGAGTWQKHTVTLTATGSTTSGRLAVLTGAAGTLRLDMVSLMPQDTWVGPVNGRSVLRKDLAQKIADLEPKFLRFPGGCVTNVGTFDTYVGSDGADRTRTYQWKETIGPVEERPTNFNFWGYNQTYGLGYLEYLMLAEDLGATPLPVLSVGANGCGSTIPEMTDDALVDRWVQDTLDLVEFATGDTSTTWGARRAELGHPEPFDLRYLGLGNEENTPTFQANFPRFQEAVEAAYPDLEIVSNSGPASGGDRFEELWEFNREREVDLVDEHYYSSPSWFLENDDRYDSYDRDDPHVFVGEYASRGNAWTNALAEAAYMTGLERNGDVVELASYAPLLANEAHTQWSPDAIWFDGSSSWGSVNYYVQQMFSTQQGDAVVPSTHEGPDLTPEPLSGGVFLSTWATAARYDDVTVTSADGSVLLDEDFSTDEWQPQAGEWAVVDGAYVQSSTTVEDARSIMPDAYDQTWTDYTLELDATKTAGAEGFLVGFAAGGPGDYFWWNLGGWGNTRQALEQSVAGGRGEVVAGGGVIETGRTYHLKVVVEGSTIRTYLDDELQLTYEVGTPRSLYQVVTSDEATGDLVVKVVNPGDSIAVTDVHLTGGFEPDGQAQVTQMVGAATDTNTRADPTNVVPVVRTVDGVAGDFTYEFPARSVTFLRLAPADRVALDASARARCVGGKVQLTVQVTNRDDARVAVTVATPFGTRTSRQVAPGRTVVHTFAARAREVEAGEVTVTGRRGDASSSSVVPYAAVSCRR